MSVYKDAIDLIAGALALAPALDAPVDISREVIAAAIGLLDAVIGDLVGTSVSVTSFVPASFKAAPTVPAMLGRVADSMFDTTDPNRPVNSGEQLFAIWVGVGSSDTVNSLASAFEALMKGLNRPANLTKPKLKSFMADAGGYPPIVSPGEGMAPNWSTQRLSDIGIIAQAVQELLKVRASLAPAATAAEMALRQVELIQEKAAALAAFTAKLNQIVTDVASLASSVAALSVLQIYGQGTLTEQAVALRSAAADPSSPFLGSQDLGACVALHAQGGNAPSVLMSLFDFPEE